MSATVNAIFGLRRDGMAQKVNPISPHINHQFSQTHSLAVCSQQSCVCVFCVIKCSTAGVFSWNRPHSIVEPFLNVEALRHVLLCVTETK